MIKVEIDNEGWHFWRKDGILHREDGPAMFREGMERWYYEGELHNDNGPAVVIKFNNKNDPLVYLPNKKPHYINKQWYIHGAFVKEEYEEINEMPNL